jgi:PAS domain S-box-containing protein
LQATDTRESEERLEYAFLRAILESTSGETGVRFFEVLVRSLSEVLGTYGAWVAEYHKELRRLRTIAFRLGDEFVHDFEYDIAGTPCEPVIDRACFLHIPDNVITLYPHDDHLVRFGAVSYMGVPIMDVNGTILGNLAVLDTRPMAEETKRFATFKIFADRAAAEFRRLRAENEVRAREERLGCLVDSVMDAIVEMDEGMNVTRANPAAERLLGLRGEQIVGWNVTRFLSAESGRKLSHLIRQFTADTQPRRLRIPGGLALGGRLVEEPSTDAALSRFVFHGIPYFTLVLRDLREQLKAERTIRSLTVQTEYLREEIRELHCFDEIIGQSEALLQVIREIGQVARTEATVLIQGETGTGKELVARAIHQASRRSTKPMIRMNCAALPASLIESELFGHVRGAFTGAMAAREGRFALADGGTLFLDEIGELSVEMQAKLLRVLQDREFEPVGSSHTRSVDVRVVAATNRDLKCAVANGSFREDLFYRLNVFPIVVPPLRERPDDIPLLASAFIAKFSHELGRAPSPLTDECIRRLQAYDWPGNIRELQNVMERAVITSHDCETSLDRSLPNVARQAPEIRPSNQPEAPASRIYTLEEMQELEKANILRALETSGWQISGTQGAARLLGIPSSTLSSRMKSLSITRSVSESRLPSKQPARSRRG